MMHKLPLLEWSPREQGAGGVREMGKERVASESSKRVGSEREM